MWRISQPINVVGERSQCTWNHKMSEWVCVCLKAASSHRQHCVFWEKRIGAKRQSNSQSFIFQENKHTLCDKHTVIHSILYQFLLMFRLNFWPHIQWVMHSLNSFKVIIKISVFCLSYDGWDVVFIYYCWAFSDPLNVLMSFFHVSYRLMQKKLLWLMLKRCRKQMSPPQDRGSLIKTLLDPWCWR